MPNQSEKLPVAPLSQAIRIFSDPAKWQAFKSVEVSTDDLLEKAGTMFEALFDSIVGDDDDKAKADKDMKSLKGYGQKVMPGQEARKELETAIIARLVSGELVANGYFSPRHPSDKKVLVPSDIWKGMPYIKWHLDIIKGQGMDLPMLAFLPVLKL